ncbi:MAG: hypothetical protein FH748_11940 [Balneolaceae bacterium]|nr:hypothetical protein [Balneolaceae bacterium]
MVQAINKASFPLLKGKTEGGVDEDFITHTISVEVDPKHILGDRRVGLVLVLIEDLGSSRAEGIPTGNGASFRKWKIVSFAGP